MEWVNAVLLIVSHDDALLESLGGKLRQWGATVHNHKPGAGKNRAVRIVDVIMVDVRQHAEKVFAGLQDIRESTPAAEMLLINSSGNVNASMAGMRAGASDELTVPCDMENLRRKVVEACQRSRSKLGKKGHLSFLKVFEDTMSAVAFAQAGEYETAISMIERPAQGNELDRGSLGSEGAPERKNKEKR